MAADGLPRAVGVVPGDSRLGGRYRYHRDPRLCGAVPAPVRQRDGLLFDTYRDLLRRWGVGAGRPEETSDSDFVYKQTIKAKACDSVRGILPPRPSPTSASTAPAGRSGAAAADNAHPLAEAHSYPR
jgi:hypothetical protein